MAYIDDDQMASFMHGIPSCPAEPFYGSKAYHERQKDITERWSIKHPCTTRIASKEEIDAIFEKGDNRSVYRY